MWFLLFGCILHATEPPLAGNPTATILFGRGSARYGLNTIEITSTREVVLHRVNHEPKRHWETATFKISEEQRRQLFNAADTNQLMFLAPKYINRTITDGTQWVLLIKRDSISKCVYFDNSFPSAIKNFANTVDSILTNQPISWNHAESRQHEKQLWDAVKDLPK